MNDQSFNPQTRGWLPVGLLLAWLSHLVYLYPLPGEPGRLTEDNVAQAAFEELYRSAVWEGWWFSLGMIMFGIATSVLLLRSTRFSELLAIVSSVAYIISWWLFSGYFTTDISIAELFKGLWAMAKINGMSVFLHRDVVLLGFYHLTTVVLLAAVFLRRSQSQSSNSIQR